MGCCHLIFSELASRRNTRRTGKCYRTHGGGTGVTRWSGLAAQPSSSGLGWTTPLKFSTAHGTSEMIPLKLDTCRMVRALVYLPYRILKHYCVHLAIVTIFVILFLSYNSMTNQASTRVVFVNNLAVSCPCWYSL